MKMFRKGRNGSESHEGDIVKKGYVYIKRPPTNTNVKIRLKAWQRRFFVLRDTSFEGGSASLEIYPNDHSWESGMKDSESYVVDLKKVTMVEEYTESKNFPNAFSVSRKGQSPLILGADLPFEMKEWFVAIKMLAGKLKNSQLLHVPDAEDRRPSCPPRIDCDSPMRAHWRSLGGGSQGGTPDNTPGAIRTLRLPPPDVLPRKVSDKNAGYLVTVYPTQSSEKNMLAGDYKMVVLSDEIVLRRPGSASNVLRWEIINIRKFKSEDSSDSGVDLVTIEGNIHCGHAEGSYCFKTRHGKELIQKVREAASRPRPERIRVTPERKHMTLSARPSHLTEALHSRRIQRIGSAPCIDVPQGLRSGKDLPDCLMSSSPLALPPRAIPPRQDSEVSSNESGDNEDEENRSYATANSYLKLVGDMDLPCSPGCESPVSPFNVMECPPLPPHGVAVGSIRRPAPIPHPDTSGPRSLGSAGSDQFSPRAPLSSDDSTQFHLDDLIPALPPTPSRLNDSLDDSGALFPFNDVFESKETITQETSSTSPHVASLDRDIPLTVEALNDNCVIAEDVFVSSSGGVKPLSGDVPPRPPPRPRHTLSQSSPKTFN